MRLYVGNLPGKLYDEELYQTFSSVGEVESAMVILERYQDNAPSGNSKGFGFVVMPNSEEAKRAVELLDGHILGGRAIRVEEVVPREDSEAPRRRTRGNFGGGRAGGGFGGGFKRPTVEIPNEPKYEPYKYVRRSYGYSRSENPEHFDLLKQGVPAWNTWRGENYRILPDLRYADLRNAYLAQANLEGAYLVGANLSEANLQSAFLVGANLTEANLSHANLRSANLTEADLTNANLSHANLQSAGLWDANLHRTLLKCSNWTRIGLAETILSDVDLKEAWNLDKVDHNGPSQVSIQTVLDNWGKVPEVFWRGCGIPEDLIRYLPSFANSPVQFYSCFISYSHADRAFARRLHDALQGRGIRCWLDEKQILPGDNIFDEVDKGIRLWDKVLLCCSEHSLKINPWWVDAEVEKAFNKERQIQKQKGQKVLALIPLNLDGALFDWEDGKATEVRKRLAADFTGWETNNAKFEEQFELVVKAPRADAKAREMPPKSVL